MGEGEAVPVHLFGEVADYVFGAIPEEGRLSVGTVSGIVTACVFGVYGVVLLVQVV